MRDGVMTLESRWSFFWPPCTLLEFFKICLVTISRNSTMPCFNSTCRGQVNLKYILISSKIMCTMCPYRWLDGTNFPSKFLIGAHRNNGKSHHFRAVPLARSNPTFSRGRKHRWIFRNFHVESDVSVRHLIIKFFTIFITKSKFQKKQFQCKATLTQL